jgi:hypothetical protein
VVARLMTRAYGGYESLQLEVRDAADAGSRQPEALEIPRPATLAVAAP